MGISEPTKITNGEFRFDAFSNGKVVLGKKKGRLPAMGWNSWNAFGSGNTEALTKIMADKIIELGLDKLGYKYVVLDDGCYKSERIEGKLSNENVKFPSGFKALSDYVHSKGLKFGMYNDIGTNLCAGAAVGTCGHEKIDAESYIEWGVDFLKIDNCYYLWDNATFSNPENARFTFAPNIKGICVRGQNSNEGQNCDRGQVYVKNLSAIKDGTIIGQGASVQNDYVTGIGTFDGTNTGTTPVGPRSGELIFNVSVPVAGKYEVTVEYATSKEPWIGEWLQLAIENSNSKEAVYFYDDLLPATENKEAFIWSKPICVELSAGENKIRIMNHRRQENTLDSYSAMLEGLNLANPNHDILLSFCEWGKTHPQNWGYKVGDSWRILNDITFRVGSDGNPGFGEWNNPGTQSVASQYNKAVVMDEFAGLDKGWNDPDMLMIGMDGLTLEMNRTHFAMWCMMNSPLMLGMDLRRLSKGDDYYNIISNADLIALNQDALGIQAKRIWTSIPCENPETEYITDDSRADIIAKPLADGSVAVSLFNLDDSNSTKVMQIDVALIKEKLGKKLPAAFEKATGFEVKDLWSKKVYDIQDKVSFDAVVPCGNITLKITPKN